MDMRKHLRRRINDAELVRLGGEYVGEISNVGEEVVRNRYTAQRELVPVISFADGWQLIPNIGMRAALVETHGADTDRWVGKRVRIFRRAVERISKVTGETRTQYIKPVMFEADAGNVVPLRREPSEYDDSPDVMPTEDEIFRSRRVQKEDR